MIHPDRLFARFDGSFVVFLIGMRINVPWKVHKWWPVARAMPRMLEELRRRPELGMLGGEMWGGRTTILLQYWRSTEHLFAYAKARDAQHLPAWREFNRATCPTARSGNMPSDPPLALHTECTSSSPTPPASHCCSADRDGRAAAARARVARRVSESPATAGL